LIFWDMEVNRLEELYRNVSKAFSKTSGIKPEIIAEAILERDKLGFPGLERGFAVPHGRIEGFEDVCFAVIKLKKPLEINGKSFDFFFILITSTKGSNFYLKTLSSLSRMMVLHGDELKRCSSPRTFLDFIEDNDLVLEEIVKIKDILIHSPKCLDLDFNIKDVLNLMKKEGVQFFPVVDAFEKYIGKIDILDILKIGFDDYLLNLNTLAFLNNYRDFEQFEQNEEKYSVKDLYVPDRDKLKTIHSDTSIVECAFAMMKNHWHHVTVIDNNGKVLVVVSSDDIVQKMIRV